jgi:hypothetical protein
MMMPRPVDVHMVPEAIHKIRSDYYLRFRGYLMVYYDSQRDLDLAMDQVRKRIKDDRSDHRGN